MAKEANNTKIVLGGGGWVTTEYTHEKMLN